MHTRKCSHHLHFDGTNHGYYHTHTYIQLHSLDSSHSTDWISTPQSERLTNTSVVSADARYIPPFHLAVPNHLFNFVVRKYRGSMPSAKASVPHNRKRQLSEADSKTDLSPQPTAKRQKLEEHQRHRTPSSFWDNLSRQWLTRRALREFNRRTVWPAAPVPPYRTGKEIDLVKLKRFARHGGPSLGNIRGVSAI